MGIEGTRDESLVNPEFDSNETKLQNSLRQKTWDETIHQRQLDGFQGNG
jgi:hypothetical protein